ncbi:Methyltransferase-like protein 16 [Oopsacas minuta]|uniref:U6 snRNA m(6)A methyltransferase n=1 Tax=Oopsacas minuta TaxID=111878 RepID=A0AAV7JTG1_9METZ|nr:Methyltransferase-like protein 16 [Oopsacas minuta]
MHPRNKYWKNPADFLQLSRSYPSLQPYIFQRTTEYGTIDFSNNKAVKELTKALLAQDFNLKWDIDEEHLVPTIPLRLNYLHWIEDLLSEDEGEVPKGPEVIGLDIGVGASCIYPLLGVRMNNWRFYGTEIATTSLQIAEKIILNNNLEDNIKLAKPVEINSNLLLTILGKEWRDVKFNFVMCNPPFYSSIKEKTGKK